jgi:hypothetical protein
VSGGTGLTLALCSSRTRLPVTAGSQRGRVPVKTTSQANKPAIDADFDEFDGAGKKIGSREGLTARGHRVVDAASFRTEPRIPFDTKDHVRYLSFDLKMEENPMKMTVEFDTESAIGRKVLALLADTGTATPRSETDATAAVKAFLRSQTDQQARHAQIRDHMRGSWQAPRRLLLRSGEIEKLGRGLYRLVEH